MPGKFKLDDDHKLASGGFTTADKPVVQEMDEVGTSGRGNAFVKKRSNRSTKTQTHNAVIVSSTSTEIDLSAYAKVMVKAIVTGATSGGSVKLHGAFAAGDAAVVFHDTGAKTASFFTTILDNPGFVKVELVRTDGTWTIEIIGIE